MDDFLVGATLDDVDLGALAGLKDVGAGYILFMEDAVDVPLKENVPNTGMEPVAINNFPTQAEGYDSKAISRTEMLTEFAMDVYPNPTSGVATVNVGYNGDATATLEMFDILGQKVLDTEQSISGHASIQINLEHLQSGQYLIKLSIGDDYISKFVTLNK